MHADSHPPGLFSVVRIASLISSLFVALGSGTNYVRLLSQIQFTFSSLLFRSSLVSALLFTVFAVCAGRIPVWYQYHGLLHTGRRGHCLK